ncbi:MAG: FAD-binding oxidoreductase [Actinomycetota bacterium]|nr:FAD-binding oxidoreductase [Actinomycetota bacterium]
MTLDPRRDTRWWGWGGPSEQATLSEAAERLIRERGIGNGPEGPRPAPVPSLEQVRIPDARPLPRAVIEAAGPDAVFSGPEDRIRHATGQSYLDLLARRSGRLDLAPDAVVTVPSAEVLLPLLESCGANGVAVVPFGGGTSVVGGVAPLRGDFDQVISLDLVNLRGFQTDPVSMTARLGAGLRGPEAEALLGAQGLTLGHFPQSFEYATIGGFAATRSAGQSSSGFGRFDSLVSSVRLVTPTGWMRTADTPHTAIGPSLRETIIGSEGIFGVIPDVDVRVRPAPAVQRREAWVAESFEAGNAIVRKLAQAGTLPTVIRVSDEAETEVSFASSAPTGLAGAAFRRYLKSRGRERGALMILSYEGTAEETRRQRGDAVKALKGGGAVALGQSGGRGWARGRFHGPYLRELLMDRGILVETFETAAQWRDHDRLYRAVGTTLEGEMKRQGMDGIVMCHLSHAYPDGASLYFTVISSPGREGGAVTWPRIKSAALDVIQGAGGSISHHHATGRDHMPWVEGEIGELGVDALRAVKEQLDPVGIMNPGKLLP